MPEEEKKDTLSDEQLEIFNEVIKQIEAGKSVRQIFKDKDFGVSRSLFYQWLNDEKEKSDQYARATSIRADIIFDEMFDIADDGTNDYINVDIGDGIEVQKLNTEHIQRSRLRIDTRKWALSKMNPKKFGDKLDVTSDNEKLNDNKQINLTIHSAKGKKEIDLGKHKDDELKAHHEN